MSSSMVRQIPLSFFVLVEHDETGRDARRDGENCCELSRFVTTVSAAIHANRRVYQTITKLTQPLDPKIGVVSLRLCTSS